MLLETQKPPSAGSSTCSSSTLKTDKSSLGSRHGRKTVMNVEDMDRQAISSGLANGTGQGGKITPHHRIRHTRSILTLAISDDHIFGGTEGGEILKWDLKSYTLAGQVTAHNGTVLGLFLSGDQQSLFSSAGDAAVNVWEARTLRRLYHIRSSYDVGDVFCVAYSSLSKTVFLGTQNTSIQWVELNEESTSGLKALPPARSHRFFDAKGPSQSHVPPQTGSGSSTPQNESGQIIEIDNESILQFAHNGYVYCMLLDEEVGRASGKGHQLISGGGDGTVKLWSHHSQKRGTLREVGRLDNGDVSVLSMALDGSLLYTGLLEGDVNVWDLDTRQLVRNIRAHTDDVLALAVTGEFILSGASCGTAKALNRRNECVLSWQAHDGLVLASAITWHHGRLLYVTGGNDNCVAIWDITDWATKAPTGSPTSNDQMVRSLEELVAFRTVSADLRYVEDCRRGATSLRQLFKRFGADAKMLGTPCNLNPIVFAVFRRSPTQQRPRRRILFYGHYDVIPADERKGNWTTDPFKLSGVDGYLYGRGASDNKGPVIAALFAAAELASTQRLGADVVFLIEGDEECGSRGFDKTILANKAAIGHIDWILLANSYWLNDDVPCLTYGHRGVIHATVTVEGDRADMHSGVHGSSMVDEPLKDLVVLLSKLTGSQGRVQIPDFYESVLPLTAAEKRRYDAITSALQRQDAAIEDADDFALSLMRRWREPSLSFHRFKASGPENASVIPGSAKATISVRLVPNQDNAQVRRMLSGYLESSFEQMKSKNRLLVEPGHEAEPWLGDPDNELFQTLEKAIVDVWCTHGAAEGSKPRGRGSSEASQDGCKRTDAGGRRCSAAKPGHPVDRPPVEKTAARDGSDVAPLYIREGGSIPAIRFLEKTFDAPAANLPCGQSSDNAHLDQERLRLTNLYKSRDIFKRMFQ